VKSPFMGNRNPYAVVYVIFASTVRVCKFATVIRCS
jgi:hypothetical protein